MKKSWWIVFLMSLVVLSITVSTWGASYPNLSITIPKVTSPVIDGRLDDAAWLNASIRGGKFVVDASNMGERLTDYPRVAYVGYDAKALYVAFIGFSPDVSKLVGSAASWWNTDEVEIFINAFNAGSVVQIGITSAGYISKSNVEAVVVKEGVRWIVEAAIPWSVVGGIAPQVGDKWGLNLCGRQLADGDMWLAYNVPFGQFANAAKLGEAVFGD